MKIHPPALRINGNWAALLSGLQLHGAQMCFTKIPRAPIHSHIHSHIHRPMGDATMQGTVHQEQFTVECFAQGHDNGLGGSGI